MRDVEGRLIKVGQKVYFTYYDWGEIQRGTVVNMTKSTISIQLSDYSMAAKIRGINSHKRVIINVN